MAHGRLRLFFHRTTLQCLYIYIYICTEMSCCCCCCGAMYRKTITAIIYIYICIQIGNSKVEETEEKKKHDREMARGEKKRTITGHEAMCSERLKSVWTRRVYRALSVYVVRGVCSEDLSRLASHVYTCSFHGPAVFFPIRLYFHTTKPCPESCVRTATDNPREIRISIRVTVACNGNCISRQGKHKHGRFAVFELVVVVFFFLRRRFPP